MADIQKTKETLKVVDKSDLYLPEEISDSRRNFWENFIGIMGDAGLEIELLEKSRKKEAANDDVDKTQEKAANDENELKKVA